MKCLNYLCGNDIEENRVKKQTRQIANFHFCMKCMRRRRADPIYYKCKKEDCNEKIMLGGFKSRSYCSNDCRLKTLQGTKLSTEKTCRNCFGKFMSNLGYVQYYCGKECKREWEKKKIELC